MQSLNTTPVVLSANAPKQKKFAIDSSSTSVMRLGSWALQSLSSSLSAMRPGMGGWSTIMGGRGGGVASCVIFCGLIVVLRRPFRGLFICPFDVAGLGWRYLRTMFAWRWGAPLRKLRFMACKSDDMGGLHRLWA